MPGASHNHTWDSLADPLVFTHLPKYLQECMRQIGTAGCIHGDLDHLEIECFQVCIVG